MIFAERKEKINITRQGEIAASGFILADKTVISKSVDIFVKNVVHFRKT